MTNTNSGKLIVFSAPSGSGKTTIVRHLLEQPELNLEFSISATSREKRGLEIDGKDYHFITAEAFKKHIDKDEFVEWEEVYTQQFLWNLKIMKLNVFGNKENMQFLILMLLVVYE